MLLKANIFSLMKTPHIFRHRISNHSGRAWLHIHWGVLKYTQMKTARLNFEYWPYCRGSCCWKIQRIYGCCSSSIIFSPDTFIAIECPSFISVLCRHCGKAAFHTICASTSIIFVAISLKRYQILWMEISSLRQCFMRHQTIFRQLGS